MSLALSRLGRYQLQRQIGSGGMGTIYLAQDTHMPRQVAIKVIRTDDELQDNSDVAQKMEKLFYREMQAIAQLDHPHILPVFDFGKEKVEEVLYTYLVMQYRPEGSLSDWLRQMRNNAALPVAEVARFIGQAAEALQHAHERGVIHQDVKPPNFLLRARSTQTGDLPDLLLADFGIARIVSSTVSQSLSQNQDVRGTPMFMAPEQWDGKAVPASDQYALGIMAFRMLTGQLPFQGSLGQIMRHHYMAQPPAPSSLNTQLDASIDAVIKRALAKQAGDRFPSIMEFAQAFAQAQGQVVADVQPDSSGNQAGSLAVATNQVSTLLPEKKTPRVAPQTVIFTDERSPGFSASAGSGQPSADGRFTFLQSSQATPTPLASPAQTPFPNPPYYGEFPSHSQISSSVAPGDHLQQIPFPASTPISQPPSQPLNGAAQTPIFTPGLISRVGLTNNAPGSMPGFNATPIPSAGPLSNPAITGMHSPTAGNQPGQMNTLLPPRPADAQAPAAYGYPAYATPTPASLPGLTANPPVVQATASRRKRSIPYVTLLLVLVALLVLGGVGTLLFKNIEAAQNDTHGNNGQSTIQTGSILPGQTPSGSGGGMVGIGTATPTHGSSSKLHTGATPTSTPASQAGSTPTATSTLGAKPTAAPTAPVAKPTTAPATPTPKPQVCLTDTWTSHLKPSFSKGGSSRNVSGACGGKVYLTLTQAPSPNAGHEVDFQICYALNSTNCSNWATYTSPDAWILVASGLARNQVFYINTRCNKCTAATTTLNGGVKY